MPFKKSADGKWVKTLGRRGNSSSAAAERLLIIDEQVDCSGNLKNAVLSEVMTLCFNSKTHKLEELVEMIRTAHAANGQPFKSIAVANHGSDRKGVWHWAKGTSLTMSKKAADDRQLVKDAARALAPVLEVMIAALEKTRMNVAHIDLLACSLNTINRAFVPYLEQLYHVDFRASDDMTGEVHPSGATPQNIRCTADLTILCRFLGGSAQQANWKMETDNDYDFAKDYLDAELSTKYTEVMGKCWGCGKGISTFLGINAWCSSCAGFTSPIQKDHLDAAAIGALAGGPAGALRGIAKAELKRQVKRYM